MDQTTHEIRLANWTAIIEQCQARPTDQTAKQWLAENNISEKQYYYWLRKLRKAAIALSGDPTGSHTEFAKVPMSTMQGSSDTPLRITRGDTVFEVTNDISDHLLLLLKEVIRVC